MERNKAKERFTRTWAIEQHRKMWHWIAQEVREGRVKNFEQLLDKKEEYISERYHNKIYASCFMCEYASHEARRRVDNNIYTMCDYCPLKLLCTEFSSSYWMLSELYDYRLSDKNCIAELCEQIAEAPERKV